jgi:hypothetical protein
LAIGAAAGLSLVAAIAGLWLPTSRVAAQERAETL